MPLYNQPSERKPRTYQQLMADARAAARENRGELSKKQKARYWLSPSWGTVKCAVPPDWLDDTCAYCGTESAFLTRDHVVPLCEGGLNAWFNVTPACEPCNHAKGGFLLAGATSDPIDWPILRRQVAELRRAREYSEEE